MLVLKKRSSTELITDDLMSLGSKFYLRLWLASILLISSFEMTPAANNGVR